MIETANFAAQFRAGDVVPPPYFTGIYPEGLEKRDFEDPFNTAEWLETCRHSARVLGIAESNFLANSSRIAKALFYLRSPKLAARHLVAGSACPAYLLPAAQMLRDVYLRSGRVSVLDVGGGYGDNFFHLLHVLPRDVVSALSYDVLDNEPSCELGRRLFSSYAVKPEFTADFASITKIYDIVVVVGTLQYLTDWRQFLSTIEQRGQGYLYVARSPIALRTKSFTTTQLICPGNGPHAGRLLGPTQINVVGLADLRETMAVTSWRASFAFMAKDYSVQFERLPQPWRDVRYFNMGWAHVD